MKKKTLLAFLLKLLSISIICIACFNPTEAEEEPGIPVVQAVLTINGLDEYNGKFVILSGYIRWADSDVFTLGITDFSGNVNDNIFVVKGIRISGGKVVVPLYCVSFYSGELSSYLTDSGSRGNYITFNSPTLFISEEETMEYSGSYNMQNIIAVGIFPSGTAGAYLRENLTVDRSAFIDWKDF